ncbi:MAG TPA: MmgE/PrpD family protein [Trebonia sp.]|nr:MmgE/PrpD family protein [Trebonia sp.]
MPENLTEELADFVTAARLEDLPGSARERARIVLADTVASALMGGRSAEVPMIERLAGAVAGPGRSPVVGRSSLAPGGAVLVNGYLITATTVCDVHKATLCHVTPEVFPPALAVAAERGATGADFLLAFALGLEITSRVGLGSNYAAFRGKGWHSPGVWGPFGGAAAAGKLLGLDARQQRNAFGLAGSQSAGTFAHWGTPTIKFHQSRGALSGFIAATLADTGFEAGADVLTAADGGLYGTYSDGGKPELALDGLGQRWELEQLSLRAWPLASSLQSVATALLHLVETEGARAAGVARVRVGLSRTVYDMHGTLPWHDRFSALLSAPFVTAVILADGACGLDQFTPERIKDAQADRFARESVRVEVDESVQGTGAVVDIELTDGRLLHDRRAVPHGDPQDPLSMADVRAKFLAAADGILPPDQAAAALDRLARIDELPAVDAALFGAAAGADTAGARASGQDQG